MFFYSPDDYDLSPVQEQFYTAYSLNKKSLAYNLYSLFDLKGDFHLDCADKTLEIMGKRYPFLDSGPLNKDYSTDNLGEIANVAFDLEREIPFRAYYLKGEIPQLLFVFHHIVFDLRSKELFALEFSQVYNDIQKDIVTELPPAGDYKLYTLWFKSFSLSEKYKRMVAYWRYKTSSSPVLDLPLDFERPSVSTGRGRRIFGYLSKVKSAKVNDYSELRHSDPFLIFLSAYAVFLYRISGQEQFSIGVPRTNRSQEDFKDILGCFVNILPLYVSIEESKGFKGLLRQIRLAMLAMHRNQNVPYLEVVRLNNRKRDRKYNPLFQVGFTSEHPMYLQLDGVDCIPRNVAPDASQLDLFFYYWNEGNSYRWALEYSTDLFQKERAESFISALEVILESVMQDDSLPLSQLSLMDKKSDQKIHDWNETDRIYPYNNSIISSFWEQAEISPESTALIYKHESLSYSKFKHRVNALASRLLTLGITKETIVGLSMERSFEMVIGMYAIVLAGGTYLPIDPALPKDYTLYLLEDSRLEFIITQRQNESLFPDTLHKLIVDDFCYSDSQQAVLSPKMDLDDRVYILYTSGSTGKPKGVEITHRGLQNRIFWMDDEYTLNEDDVLIQKTPFNFDVSGWEFWWPLMKGVPLVIAEPDGHKDNSYLIKTIEEQKVTKIHFVPSMLREFLKFFSKGQCTSLKEVFCSGETLPTAVVHEFYEKLPHVRLHNLYGPTEASIDVTYWPCTPDCTNVPIGKPIANTKVYILDEYLNLLPPGVTGEIYLTGMGLARGYLNKPEMTMERFIPNPFDGGRMYKTGDLGQWSIRGEILYLGRNDSQVQLHGLRIELEEIENTLNSHSKVDVSAVIVHGEFGTDQSLFAYVKTKEAVSREALIEYMEQHLPLHMVPRRMLFLEEVVLNCNGKLDRKSLPDPVTAEPIPNHEYVTPEGEVEAGIACIWEELLGLEKVGRNDHFFDIGGSSLHVIQLQKKFKDYLGREIPITDLFTHTTVSSLAKYLDEGENTQKNWANYSERRNRSRLAAQRLKNIRKN